MVFAVIPYISLDLLKVQLVYFKKNSFIIIYKIIVMKGRKHFHHDRHFVTTKSTLSAQGLIVSFCNLSSVLLEFPAETVLNIYCLDFIFTLLMLGLGYLTQIRYWLSFLIH